MCGHIWHVLWDRKGANKVLDGKPEGKAATANLSVGKRLILKWIKKQDRGTRGLD
jgi:hypothetical protein